MHGRDLAPASDPTIARGIYKTDKYGDKAEQMTTFDPDAEKIIAPRSTSGAENVEPEPDYEEQLLAAYGKTSQELADEAEAGYDPAKFVPYHRKTPLTNKVKKRTIKMSSLIGFLIIAIILFIPTYAIWNTIQHNKARRMQIQDLKARKRERRGDLR